MFEMRWKSQKNMFMEHHDIAVLPFNDIKQRTLQSVAKSIWHMYNRLTIRTLERSSRRIEGLMCSTAEDTIHHIETKKNWMRVLYNMRRFSARNVSNRTKENKSAEPSKMVYFYVKLKNKTGNWNYMFYWWFFLARKERTRRILGFYWESWKWIYKGAYKVGIEHRKMS